MPTKRQFARNVLLNWASIGVSMAVPFFLSPFVVHRLGDLAYGVWILVVASITYLNLLDLGLRSAIVRFVSRAATQGDHAEARRVLVAALWIRAWIAAAILVAGIGLAIVFPHVFKVPPELARVAQWAVVVTAVNAAGTLVLDVFSAVLVSLHRYDLNSTVGMAQSLVRAGGTVWLLLAGYGLFSLAVIELVAATFGGLCYLLLALHVYPELRRPAPRVAGVTRRIWHYSFYSFLIGISFQLVYNSDNVVVGAFVSAAAVTYYSIAGSLVMYARQIVTAMSSTFTPLASNYETEGRMDALRRLLIRGTQASLGLCLPISIALFFRGHTFIRLWMGDRYGAISGTVVQILLINQVFVLANATAGGIAFGTERHRAVARWAVGEGVANLALSILLVRHIGIYGVAWGTVVPALVTQLGFWPRHARAMTGIQIHDYLWQGWGRVLVASVPYAAACYLTERFLHAANLLHFFLQIAAVLPVFGAGLALAFWREALPVVRARLGWARAAA